MQTPKDTSEMMVDPQKMQSIVDRLKAEGRMPTLEKLVLRKYRKEYPISGTGKADKMVTFRGSWKPDDPIWLSKKAKDDPEA